MIQLQRYGLTQPVYPRMVRPAFQNPVAVPLPDISLGLHSLTEHPSFEVRPCRVLHTSWSFQPDFQAPGFTDTKRIA
ncbi:MAG: hypothetical protein AB2805_16535 [Candidatus Thiodiazotropha sp.]